MALLATGCSGAVTTRSQAAPGPRTLRVVGLGDSVMSGVNCNCAGLAEEYGRALAQRTGKRVQVTNLGMSGLVTTELVIDLRHDSRTRAAISDADVVLVTIGANDLLPEFDDWQAGGCDTACVGSGAATMGQHMQQVLTSLAALRRGNDGPVLVTNYWNLFTDGSVARRSGGQAQIDWTRQVTATANKEICSAAHAAADICVDLVEPFEGWGADPTALLAADGDHPNAAGVRAIVTQLLQATPADP